MRELLELGQRGRAVAKYVAQFYHLKRYCLHIFNTDQEHAEKIVWGLDEGLRAKVISDDPQTLLKAVEVATRLEEDYSWS